MIGRYVVLVVKSNNESGIPFLPVNFVNTGFFAGEFCVLTRQAKLRVNPAVAFNLANCYVGDVCELVCHRNLHTPSQLY
jgi:hypothetical protein